MTQKTPRWFIPVMLLVIAFAVIAGLELTGVIHDHYFHDPSVRLLA